jgi:hypothetical protein
VEVFEAPAGGPTPEAAQAWNPTPNPICPAPAPISSEESGGVAAQSQDVAGGGEAASGGEAAGVKSGGLAAEVAGPPAETGAVDEAAAASGSVSQPGTSLSTGNLEDGGVDLTWLLLIGIALILGGAIAFLVLARLSGSGSTS